MKDEFNSELPMISGKPRVVIVDLDDVLFHTNPIFARAEEMGLSGDDLWQYFHKEVHKCSVNGWCRDLIIALKFSGITPVFITARSEEIWRETGMSIVKCLDMAYFNLHMRKLGDKRPGDIVKEEILHDEVLPRYAVLFALDDDIKNCEMYVKYGIPVLHVMNAEGKADTNIVKYSKTVDWCAFRGDFMHVTNRRGFENG
ncbi:hypothetical protein DBY21_02770 [Candidatus Gastranaerophilales bacterium]|nr:MAG: hypothetical protein DBY21_02770 [Candidatus Gastranaerophilales bacterium]